MPPIPGIPGVGIQCPPLASTCLSLRSLSRTVKSAMNRPHRRVAKPHTGCSRNVLQDCKLYCVGKMYS